MCKNLAFDIKHLILPIFKKKELISVKKANPRESSKTSEIINILEDFSNWTETNKDAAILLKLENQIDDFLRSSP